MIGVCTGVIILLFSDVASNLRRCPYGTHKRIRAQWKCSDKNQYHCLLDKNDHILIEICRHPKNYRKGVRPVYKGNIDAEKCAVDNFSPGSIKSNENDKCTFIKSLCNEEGQLVFKNGSTETDRSCRCDYRRGYDFMSTPINPCSCIPFDEDCSCYKKKCQVLTPDYICTQGYNDSDTFRCPRITNSDNHYQSTEAPRTLTTEEKNTVIKLKQYYEWKPIITVLIVVHLAVLSVVMVLISRKRQLRLCERKSTTVVAESEFTDVYWKEEMVRYFQDVQQLKDIGIAYSKKETRLIILRGMHGAGKTQAAFKFCWNCQNKYTIIAKLIATTHDSLIDSLKRLANRLLLKFPCPPKSSDSGVNPIQSMALLLGEYFNHKIRSKCSYLILIDDVRITNYPTDPLSGFVSSLFEKVEMLKFIITTTENDLFGDFSEEIRQEISFNGMSRNEYMPFLRKTEMFKLESDENIDKLVQTVGALPLTLNSARKYIGNVNMSIAYYLKALEELESTPEQYTEKIKDSAIPSLLISLKKIINVLKKENEDIMEVIMCLRYFDYKAVWPDIIEVCCRHFAGVKSSPKIAATAIVNSFLEYSLCHFVIRPNEKILSFHAETMLALKLYDKQENRKTDCERLWFLIQMFCFEIDIDVRVDISLDRNMLFLVHARKVIKELEKKEDNDNVTDGEKLMQRQVYLCYLHYVIGKTKLFQATDIPLAHEHLMKARYLCLHLFKYSSDLAENKCLYLKGTEDIPDMKSTILNEAFKSLCAKRMGNAFAEAFVCGKYRNLRDVQILQKASENQNVCKFGYLSKEDYNFLSKNPSLALSLDLISEGFLSELMLHIFFDNGRALDELQYLTNNKSHVKKGRDFEFQTCIEFSDLMKLRDKFKEYPLLRYLAQDRGEQSYKLEKEYKTPSTESLKRRLSDIRKVKGNTQKNYFQLGILKTSANAHDYHNCQCYRLLLKYHQQLYKLSESNETLSEGRKDEEEFQKILLEMEHDKKPYKWMEMPKFYIQCAQFLYLSKKIEDYEKSLEFFQKAIDFEENRGVYLTRCLWEGYYGKTKCLLLLKRKGEAKTISDQLRNRLEGTNQTMRIKKLDELFNQANI